MPGHHTNKFIWGQVQLPINAADCVNYRRDTVRQSMAGQHAPVPRLQGGGEPSSSADVKTSCVMYANSCCMQGRDDLF